MERGKTSEAMIHDTGPQEYAKLAIKIQTKTIAAQPASEWFSQSPLYDPMIPATIYLCNISVRA